MSPPWWLRCSRHASSGPGPIPRFCERGMLDMFMASCTKHVRIRSWCRQRGCGTHGRSAATQPLFCCQLCEVYAVSHAQEKVQALPHNMLPCSASTICPALRAMRNACRLPAGSNMQACALLQKQPCPACVALQRTLSVSPFCVKGIFVAGRQPCILETKVV